MKKLILILCVLFAFNGCAFKGAVYVAIHWYQHDPANMPTSLTHNIPNVPMTLPPAAGSIVAGAYYLTLPGAYNFTPQYGAITYPISITLETKAAVLGVEDNYYDIVCFPTSDPIIQPVPTF